MTFADSIPPRDRLVLRLPQVLAAVGLSRSTWYAMIAAGEAPPPLKIGKRASGWIASDIDEHIYQRKVAPLRAALASGQKAGLPLPR